MSAQATTVNDVNPGNIEEIANWTGKRFGEFRGYRIVAEDIRILSHTGGFAIFLPPDFWKKLDHQVPLSVPKQENTACWIAGKNFTFVKVDTDPSELEDSHKDYVNTDVEVALNKIESFVRKNYFENPQAYPDSEYFTYGSFLENPSLPRPFRLRLGGDFQYQF